MKRNIRSFILTIVFLSFSVCVFSQENNRLDRIREGFSSIQNDVPGLDERVDITLTNSSLQSFLAGIGKAHRINIIVDPAVDQNISVNFTDENVRNILLFICQKYELDIQFTGSILYFAKVKKEVIPKYRKLDIALNSDNTLTLDLQSDTLSEVVKQLAKLTGVNIVVEPEARYKLVNGYIQREPLPSVLEKLSNSNNLEYTKAKDGSFSLGLYESDKPTAQGGGYNNQNYSGATSAQTPSKAQPFKKTKSASIPFKIDKNVNGESFITVDIVNQPLADILKSVSDELNINYVFQCEIAGVITMAVSKVTYEQLLNTLLKATTYSYRREGNIYLFGERPREGIRDSRVVALQYRGVKDVVEAIPKEITQGIQIHPFPELNSIILSGGSLNIQEVENFIKAIDKPVPVVTIEIMILDINKSHDVSGGIRAGVGSAPATSGGSILPGVDFTLGSGPLNDFLDKIGLSNLGKLVPNFYVGLKALETNGVLEIQSTPKLATLNGHKASINIGETSYYLEQNQNVVGVQNPQTIVTNVYKPVAADFTIDIEPIVSGNENVTLNIKVNQSDFTTRLNANAPPGQTSRKFESMIRVKNEEVVLLGGLEKTTKSDSGTGWPLLARVPFLKWIFGMRDKSKKKSKLLILIKPTIMY